MKPLISLRLMMVFLLNMFFILLTKKYHTSKTMRVKVNLLESVKKN